MARRQDYLTRVRPRSTRFRTLLTFFLLVFGVTMAATALPASAASAPSVTKVTPSSGSVDGGQVVVIKGTDFTGATAVAFDATAATSFAVVSATEIVAVAPDAAAAGTALVKVTTPDGTNSTGVSYEFEAATIKSITPAYADAAAASVVTIKGTGFTGTVAADVKFGTVAATDIWVISDSQIVAKTPVTSVAVPIANGELDVTVTRNSVASATSDKSKFLFTPGIPTITTLGTVAVPVTGTDGAAAGTLLTVTGTRLWAVTKVTFGSAKVTSAADIVVAADGNSMTVKVPTKSSGPVDVIVENASGESLSNLSTRFAYYSTAAPKINSVSHNVFNKAAATGGGTFLVAGSGFTGVSTTDVTLKCTTDITPSTVTAVSDTSVIVTIPGNVGDAAEACDLEIVNPIDNTKTTTKTDAIRYL